MLTLDLVKGGSAVVLETDGDRVTLLSSLSSPPGSTLELALEGESFRVKVRGCKKVDADAADSQLSHRGALGEPLAQRARQGHGYFGVKTRPSSAPKKTPPEIVALPGGELERDAAQDQAPRHSPRRDAARERGEAARARSRARVTTRSESDRECRRRQSTPLNVRTPARAATPASRSRTLVSTKRREKPSSSSRLSDNAFRRVELTTPHAGSHVEATERLHRELERERRSHQIEIAAVDYFRGESASERHGTVERARAFDALPLGGERPLPLGCPALSQASRAQEPRELGRGQRDAPRPEAPSVCRRDQPHPVGFAALPELDADPACFGAQHTEKERRVFAPLGGRDLHVLDLEIDEAPRGARVEQGLGARIELDDRGVGVGARERDPEKNAAPNDAALRRLRRGDSTRRGRWHGFGLGLEPGVALRQALEFTSELVAATPVGEVLFILVDEPRRELPVPTGQSGLDLAGGRIFGEVAGGRQASIQGEGFGRAGFVPRLLEHVAERERRERRFRRVG